MSEPSAFMTLTPDGWTQGSEYKGGAVEDDLRPVR
jgi:hypothetical protein